MATRATATPSTCGAPYRRTRRPAWRPCTSRIRSRPSAAAISPGIRSFRAASSRARSALRSRPGPIRTCSSSRAPTRSPRWGSTRRSGAAKRRLRPAPTCCSSRRRAPRRTWPRRWRLRTPLLYNYAPGGRSPLLPFARLRELGFAIILLPVDTLLVAVQAMRAFLGQVKARDDVLSLADRYMPFAEFNELIGATAQLALAERYRDDDRSAT